MTKTWFITGTSSGLGRLLVERLLARGDRVVGTLRRPGALDDLLAQYGDRLRVLTYIPQVEDTIWREFRCQSGGRMRIQGRRVA
jgi:NAD(P)-dependent dehydrogenase (short-subunit alcohol dehydrogenase family)